MGYSTSCVFCGSIHRKVLDLGLHPHSDYFPKDNKNQLSIFPLNLVRCTSCQLYQIDYHLDRDSLFNDDYIYDSSINRGAQKHWSSFAESIANIFDNHTKKLTHLDIGSNAGELNEAFSRFGFDSYGVEPSFGPYKKAISLGRKSINSFFDRNITSEIPFDKFNVITFTNSFPHIPDPFSTLSLAKELLDKDNGIIIIESPSARSMIDNFQYDQIYHQHMIYLDYAPLSKFVKELNMEIFDIENTDFHNGSTRYLISNIGNYELRRNVIQLSLESEKLENSSLEEENIFREGCLKKRTTFKNKITKYNDDKKRICCVSAPAKGNTILNYCNISSKDIPFTTEANMMKVGRFTPLSSLPILEDEALYEYSPDVVIILAWNFMQDISNAIKRYVPKAKFIKPF